MADAVMVTGARAPVALHWAWALRATGRRAFLADSLRWPIGAALGFSDGYLRHAPPRHDLAGFRRDLLALCERHRIGLILPTCEEVFWLARIADDLAQVGVRVFAPALPTLAQAHDKGRLIERCKPVWPHLPHTRRLTSPKDLPMPDEAAGLVLKPAFSRFATRTLIRPTAAQLARIQPSPRDAWVAQTCLTGREVCAYAIAVAGRVTALSVYHPAYRAGQGAGICFQPVDPAPALHFVTAFAAETGWTGQLSFDLIETPDGLAPIECNPRATSGLHLLRDSQALCAALEGGPPLLVPPDTRPQSVALAMWLYAAWPNRHRLRAFRGDLAASDQALAWGSTRVSLPAQMRAVAEIAAIALRRRIGLQAASTDDIEWNGP